MVDGYVINTLDEKLYPGLEMRQGIYHKTKDGEKLVCLCGDPFLTERIALFLNEKKSEDVE